jgi:phosphopantetheine adenylyltransferase
MTAVEKAEELFLKINKEGLHQISNVINRHIRKQMIKQCAKIAVDEILNGLNSITDKYVELGMRAFWQEVKQEIEKL